jgi:hypothetical protein
MEQLGVHERGHSSLEKKETLGYVVIYCFYKNLLFLPSSPHLCLVTRENRDNGILNMPLTPEL